MTTTQGESPASKSFRVDAFEVHLAEIRAEKARKVAMIGDVSNGAILTDGNNTRWVFLLPDMTEAGRWRMQRFDHRGFSGHAIYNTVDELVAATAGEGFVQHDPTALDRLQDTLSFQRGNFASDLIRQINMGTLTHAEADVLLAEHDAAHAAIH